MTEQTSRLAAPAPGAMAVDIEERVNFTRLHEYRLFRAREALDRSELGALLCFDCNNIRYITSTAIGEWSRDKLTRYSLLTRRGEPMVWDFGSAAVYHRLHSPWIEAQNSRPAISTMRGAVDPASELPDRLASEIADVLRLYLRTSWNSLIMWVLSTGGLMIHTLPSGRSTSLLRHLP